MLQLDNISVHYGRICAVKELSLEVRQGEIVALLGANGAGKTTTLSAVSGLIRPSSGQIMLNGRRIDHLPPHQIAAGGLALVPEGRAILGTMNVLENLELGAYRISDRKQVKENLDTCFKLFPRLKERQNQQADSLSGGEQQMLAIARGLMAGPGIMLLDEPSMGLAPLIVKEVFRIIKDINTGGTSILLVEQNVKMALSVSHRAYVLERGSIVLEGKGDEIIKNNNVVNAYLGMAL